jgi:dihydrolipoamide dehydrogenase
MTMNQNVIETDVAIIGAGTAGMTAYRAALAHTPRVLVIESGVYGTTCARVGCMPSKLLIAAADAAHASPARALRRARPGPVRIDGRAVMARVRSERDRFVGFVVDAVEQLAGRAPPAGPCTLRRRPHAAGRVHTQVRRQRIVIATGSRPNVPTAWRGAGRAADRQRRCLRLDRPATLGRGGGRRGDRPGAGAGAAPAGRACAAVRPWRPCRPADRPGAAGVARQVFAHELPLTLHARSLEPRREATRW